MSKCIPIKPLTASDVERFWSKVDKSGECWHWIGARETDGYGIFYCQGKVWKSHRISYFMAAGELDASLQVDHKCHVRACVNPTHLRMVTNKQNGENRQGANARSKTGVRGVSFEKFTGRYRVDITHNGKRYNGGRFDTVEAAAEAAVALRESLFTHNEEVVA